MHTALMVFIGLYFSSLVFSSTHTGMLLGVIIHSLDFVQLIDSDRRHASRIVLMVVSAFIV